MPIMSATWRRDVSGGPTICGDRTDASWSQGSVRGAGRGKEPPARRDQAGVIPDGPLVIHSNGVMPDAVDLRARGVDCPLEIRGRALEEANRSETSSAATTTTR